MDHLSALQLNLSNERMRLSNAKTAAERELRQVWVAQLGKEVAQELGYVMPEISDDDLLSELNG